jgi:hypothetical protein
MFWAAGKMMDVQRCGASVARPPPTCLNGIALLTTALDALVDVRKPRHLFRRAVRGSSARS